MKQRIAVFVRNVRDISAGVQIFFNQRQRCIGYPEKRHIFGRQKTVYRLRIKVVEFFKKQPIIAQQFPFDKQTGIVQIK